MPLTSPVATMLPPAVIFPVARITPTLVMFPVIWEPASEPEIDVTELTQPRTPLVTLSAVPAGQLLPAVSPAACDAVPALVAKSAESALVAFVAVFADPAEVANVALFALVADPALVAKPADPAVVA